MSVNSDTLRNAEVDPEGDNLLDLADFYCNAATEALRANDPTLASARAQIAISIGINRLVDLLDRVTYDRGDGEYFLWWPRSTARPDNCASCNSPYWQTPTENGNAKPCRCKACKKKKIA